MTAQPVEAETKLSFTALGDLLETVVDDVLRELPEPQRRALAVALLLEAPRGRPPDARAVAAGFLGAVRALAVEPPLVIAVDDVQWLDAESRTVLEFAARRIRQEPIALVLALRSKGTVRLSDDFDRALGDRLQRLRVGPLSLGAIHHVVATRLGTTFPRPILRRIHETANGNPLFALEIGRALQGREALDPGAPLPVPDELRALLEERIEALPAETREALVAAAALSEPTTAVVEGATGAGRLDPAVAGQVIEVAAGRIRFSHPLFASAVLAAADEATRRRLHRRLADVVSDPEERARHLALAAERPDEAVAAALEEAARRAHGRGAPAAAADLLAQARRLTPASQPENIHGRLLEESEYALQAGDSARARALVESALAGSSRGRPRAEALTQLARFHFIGVEWRRAADLHRQAVSEAPDDVALRATNELGIAKALVILREDIRQAAAHAAAAVALADQAGAREVLAEALVQQAEAETLLGKDRPDLVDRALALERESGVVSGAIRPTLYTSLIRSWFDDFEGAIAGYGDVEKDAAEHGDESLLAWILARKALVECVAGAWSDALRDVDAADEMVVQAGQVANEAVVLATRALVEAHLGHPGPARDDAVRALELAERTDAGIARWIGRWALGFLELSLGRPSEAHSALEPLVRDARAASIREPGDLRFLPDAVEALVALGRRSDAENVLSYLEECAGTTGRTSAVATSARCRGLLAAAEGETERALEHFAGALEAHDAALIPFERARTLLALGAVQRRAKAKRAARAALEEALGTFDDLGAPLWAEKGRAELARISGRAPSRGALTPTEERVAALVAEGRTNREVAAALFVTDRTVEFHLSRIYSKLGLRSRAELARVFSAKP